MRLALDLGVTLDRIDTIIAFRAAQELGVEAEGGASTTNTEVLAQVADLVATGRMHVPIAATHPLDQVREVCAALEQRHTPGKIVLVPDVA